MRSVILAVVAVLSAPLTARQGGTTAPVVYRVSFPAPGTSLRAGRGDLRQVPQPLEPRMSRSSPGRYALHEFAKNVYDVHAFDGKGKALASRVRIPTNGTSTGHDGTVRITYKVYGDHVDGTYLGIDPTHAHMNMPATLMWARASGRPAGARHVRAARRARLEARDAALPDDRPVDLHRAEPAVPVRQPDRAERATRCASSRSHNPDGKAYHDSRGRALTTRADEEVDRLRGGRGEDRQGGGDGLRRVPAVRHRHLHVSRRTICRTTAATAWSIATARSSRGRALSQGMASSTASHEFFHCWNVERIRPQGLEPFNFEEANMTDSLWLAEGFTQYYGSLIMARAGLVDAERRPSADRAASPTASSTDPGRQFRSAVEMSQMAPFTDAARAVDRDELQHDVHFLLHLRRRDCARPRPDAARSHRRQGHAGRLHARDVARVTASRAAPQPGLVGQTVLPHRRARSAGRSVAATGRSPTTSSTGTSQAREVVDYARLLRARRCACCASANAGARGSAISGRSTDEDRPQLVCARGSPAYDAGPRAGRRDHRRRMARTIATPQACFRRSLRAQARRSDAVAFKRRDGPRHGDDRVERGSIARGRAVECDRRHADRGSRKTFRDSRGSGRKRHATRVTSERACKMRPKHPALHRARHRDVSSSDAATAAGLRRTGGTRPGWCRASVGATTERHSPSRRRPRQSPSVRGAPERVARPGRERREVSRCFLAGTTCAFLRPPWNV